MEAEETYEPASKEAVGMAECGPRRGPDRMFLFLCLVFSFPFVLFFRCPGSPAITEHHRTGTG